MRSALLLPDAVPSRMAYGAIGAHSWAIIVAGGWAAGAGLMMVLGGGPSTVSLALARAMAEGARLPRMVRGSLLGRVLPAREASASAKASCPCSSAN